MVKVNYNLRNPKSETPTPLNCVIRYNNQKLVYPTGINIEPKFWDTTTQKAKNTKSYPIHPEVNQSLKDLETTIQKVFRSFKNENQCFPSVDELRESLNIETKRTIKEKPLELFDWIKKFREEAKTKINAKTGKTFAAKTLTAYKQLHELLVAFNKSYKKRELRFNDIDLEFYNDFKEYLIKQKEYSINTIGKHFKTLKTIMNEALERGLTENRKFQNKKFAVDRMATDSVYLTLDELSLIQGLDLTNDTKLERVRDLFLIGCYTGLRFSDFTNIKNENIIDQTLIIETKKTGAKVAIPIHENIKPIFEKYMVEGGNPLPRALSNQKMNAYIKEICKKIETLNTFHSVKENKAGMTYFTKYQKFDLVTTHTARRSFATNNFKSGLPAQVIMAITGHKTEKSFLTYIKVTPEENAEIMRLHWDKMSNLKVS